MSNQIAIRNQKERKKKAVHAELARERDTNVGVENFLALFAAYRARVEGLNRNEVKNRNEKMKVCVM